MAGRTPWLDRSGFTLIEVLIAMTVLVFGLVSTCGLFAYAMATQHRAERRGLASFLVLEKLESLRTSAPGALIPGGNLDGRAPIPNYSDYLITARGGRPTGTAIPAEADIVRVWRIVGRNPAHLEVAVFALTEIVDRGAPLASASTSRTFGR